MAGDPLASYVIAVEVVNRGLFYVMYHGNNSEIRTNYNIKFELMRRLFTVCIRKR
jgi:hypothetical protein